MTDKERLEEVKSVYEDYKELQKKGDFKQADIALLYLSENHIDWLINIIEELETKLSINTNNMKHLQNKIDRYKQALEFYADEESYEPLEVQIGAVTKEGYKISKYKYDPKINTDKGEKARQALGWEEEK